ncbi:CAZyme family GH47 [Agaricus bisporus var. burnettii]|uniref:alpha-1,2-Mannosidase n=1 Tax=Agaricus bisporus var. burnettii TaxID=192524 RepID=A0A8H7C8L6_AGABI|nr:CAZyme family GH47 [Agaricus bisporus var. burnettii]
MLSRFFFRVAVAAVLVVSLVALRFFFTGSHKLLYTDTYPLETGERLQQYIPPRPYPPPLRPDSSSDPWNQRAQRVRNAFVYAWQGYSKYAAGRDELTPIDGGSVNNFNGWGVTLFDALDTLWLMGLHDEFRQSLHFVAKTNFTLDKDKYAPFFETTIRYLGGLLSAYALSGEPVLLSRADDLGRMLLPAFNTTSGLPRYAVNTVTGQIKDGWNPHVLYAEALSNQLEYKYLAHLTGRSEYFAKTESIMQLMYKAETTNGLYATMWNMQSGIPANKHFSVGAYADSAYEYLLKQYLLTARSEPQGLELYLNSVNGIIDNLLYITPVRNLLYVTDTNSGVPTHKLEHLSCFLPGLLALGILSLPTSPTTGSSSFTKKERQLHIWAAQGLAETCWIMYHDSKSGLAPDEVRMLDFENWSENKFARDITAEEVNEGLWVNQIGKWEKAGKPGGTPPGVPSLGQNVERKEDPTQREYQPIKDSYLLRPETIESFFYMWKLTKDPKWRERGWSIFEAIEKHSKTDYGYASLSTADSDKPVLENEMPSYFMAETLKYLYLLFREDDIVSLEDWVFNTEAHPFPIFDWSPWEKQEYNITV